MPSAAMELAATAPQALQMQRRVPTARWRLSATIRRSELSNSTRCRNWISTCTSVASTRAARRTSSQQGWRAIPRLGMKVTADWDSAMPAAGRRLSRSARPPHQATYGSPDWRWRARTGLFPTRSAAAPAIPATSSKDRSVSGIASTEGRRAPSRWARSMRITSRTLGAVWRAQAEATSGQPHSDQNMVFTSFRYVLP